MFNSRGAGFEIAMTFWLKFKATPHQKFERIYCIFVSFLSIQLKQSIYLNNKPSRPGWVSMSSDVGVVLTGDRHSAGE